MSSLNKSILFLFIGFLALGVLPFASFAASKGTVIISVQKDGDGFSGDWYLHQGTTIQGFLVRNGSSGETFEVDAGSYYLEVRNIPDDAPYYLLHSENPQTVDEGETIVFNVEYFDTEEEMLIASGNPPAPEPAEEEEYVGEGYDIFDVHGCNSTQGYVWCARDEMCVKYWSPACIVDEAEEEPEEVTEETSEETASTTLAASPSVYVPTFETPPQEVVPTWEMPPPTFQPEVPEDEDGFVLPVQLAQTGPSALFALIPSMLIGLAAFRRKN